MEEHFKLDIRVLTVELLDTGRYLITLKTEYINPEKNAATFETEPAIAYFLQNMVEYALPIS
jgi:hypothetical protein